MERKELIKDFFKRPILIAVISSISGILIGVYLNKSILLFVAVLFIGILLIVFYKIKVYKKMIIFILFFCFFVIYSNKLNYSYNNKYKEFIGNNIEVVGTIISDIEEKENYYIFKIRINQILDKHNKNYKGDILIVNAKKKNNLIEFKYGLKIFVSGIYKDPQSRRNYKGFDYKFYLKTNKVYGTIIQEESNIKVIKENDISMFNLWNYKIKEKIKINLRKVLPKKKANLVLGILIGEKSGIDDDIKKAFKDSSVSHMIVVSGQHMAYVILIINTIFNKKIFGSNLKKVLTIISIIWYMNLVGNSVSVLRAGIATIIYVTAGLVHRKNDSITAISLSLLITLFCNPFNIFNIGALLSYAGTLGLVLVYNIVIQRLHLKNKLLSNIILTLSANVLIIPITIYNFNTISFTFIISNLLISPLIAFAIYAGFGTALISMFSIKMANFFGIILDKILSIIINITSYFSTLNFSKIYVVTPNIIIIIFYYLSFILIIYKVRNKMKIKKIISVVLIITIISNINIFYDRKLVIHFVDVGQGDCTVITTPNNKKIIIDGGGSSSEYDVGEKILVPYLLDRRIKTIDYIIITHFDSDHCKGIFTVIKELNVKNIVISKQLEESENYNEFKEIVKEKCIKVLIMEAGESIKIEKNLHINILWPDLKSVINENLLNNNSIVCKLVYKKISILFAGDIEKIAEEALIEKYKNSNILTSTILKVAHHGSKTSSDISFLTYVNPKIALIGVGEGNKFGHPSEITLDNLNKFNCKIYRTDFNGEISIYTDGNKINCINCVY